MSHFTLLTSLRSLSVNRTVEIGFKIEDFQDIQRSVTDQGSEVGARNIPAFASPRDDPLVGVQALILSAKEFQKLLNVLPDSMTFEQLFDSQCTPFDPFPPPFETSSGVRLFSHSPVCPFRRCF